MLVSITALTKIMSDVGNQGRKPPTRGWNVVHLLAEFEASVSAGAAGYRSTTELGCGGVLGILQNGVFERPVGNEMRARERLSCLSTYLGSSQPRLDSSPPQ